MDLYQYIKEKYPKGLNHEFTNEEKAGYLAAIQDVKRALSLGFVISSVCTCKNAELEKGSLAPVYCLNCDAYVQTDVLADC